MSVNKSANQPKSARRQPNIKAGWNRLRRGFFEKFHSLRGRRIVHFLHIGKTGGTAINFALKSNLVTDDFLIRRHGHKTRLDQIPNGHGVVFFLRDPQSRFVSGFFSRLREGRPRFINPWSAREKIIFEKFPTPNHLALALSNDNLDTRREAEQAMQTIAHVRDHYSRWFGSESYFLSRLSDIYFIGFQETLDADFQRLKTTLGLPNTLELPDDDVQAHRSPSGLDHRIDPEAEENLRRWYAEDFKFVQLCRAHARKVSIRLTLASLFDFSELLVPISQLVEKF